MLYQRDLGLETYLLTTCRSQPTEKEVHYLYRFWTRHYPQKSS